MDIQKYFSKLARNEPISEDEIVLLLKAYEAAQQGLLYLASCQAATLEGLPKSASNRARERHVMLCRLASQFIEGNISGIRYPEKSVEAVRERCLKAAGSV